MPSQDQQLIKNNNQKTIFDHIRMNPGVSRAALAKSCHLSKPAVSDLTGELIQNGFIYDIGILDSSAAGRKPNGLELKTGSHFTLVFRFDNSYLQLQAIDVCGFCAYKIRLKRESDQTFAQLARKQTDILLQSQFQHAQIIGICFVVPAMIDLERLEIYSTALSLSDSEASHMLTELKELFPDFSTAVFNDTACLAYAEKIYSPVTENDFAFINFDRGIGAALFINGQMLGKASASYTQFGHVSVNPDGPLCSCGNRGCLERMVGEAYLPLSYEQLGQLAGNDDKNSVKKMDEIAELFSYALCSLICMVRPKCIILGGNAYQLGPYFLESLNRRLSVRGFRRMMEPLSVRYSIQGPDACYIGAMKYFFDQYYNFSIDCTGEFHIG